MQTVQIKGSLRESRGTAGSKEIRNAGRIPAVVYGGGDVVHISVTEKDVKHLLYTPDFKLAEIDIDGTISKCILKDVQAHPVTDAIQHLDFLRLKDGHPVSVEIPIRVKGVSPGVKDGGILLQLVRRVQIKTTPEHLVDELFVDISELVLGSSVRVKDIEVNEHLQVMNSANIPVASVQVPRALKSAEDEAEGEEGEGDEAVVETAPVEE